MLACLGGAVMLFISEGSYRQSIATLDELNAFHAARASLIVLTQGLLDAETGQRGYLLTDRQEYVRTYAEGLAQVNQAFRQMDAYYAGSPDRLDSLRALRAAVDVKLAELAQTTRLHDAGQRAAAIELVLGDIGRQKMLQIRALSTAMLERESSNVVQGRDHIRRTLMLSRIGVALSSVVILAALYLYLRQSVSLERQQLEAQRLMKDERDRLERDVVRRTAQLTQLAHHLQSAREDERNRLARDLHDELGALLTSAKLDAARMRSRLVGAAPAVLERLTHLVATLDSVIALKRRITEDLRPSTLSHLGLVATLEILAREFAERSGLEVHCALAEVRLEASAQLVVYRLVQEAVTNITKYAKARQVWLELAERDGKVEVSVRDDGVGFDSAAPNTSAFGLVGMRYRVEAEGGSLRVDSAPGHGTCVRAVLPRAPDSVANAA